VAGKQSLHRLCAELDFPSPRSCQPASELQALRPAVRHQTRGDQQ
jgi:hypothetical protein